MSTTGRAVPFYCPYCGEEDLVPEVPAGATGEGHGHWACRSCRRAFRLSLTALASASTATTPTNHGPVPTTPEETP
ncbi:transposase [Frankia sp. CNm7]|uniref:Transposase n=1 Tax=Frankia nepalensis TaxID=1836974 RepID=A0A937RRJ5_9ACTN|nr:transposase [Frankia nepalensis]MBL7496052.1 transposase [Frankia nepalensis]MBL7511827.1 transposase [Frankia nepalensis]MBL7517228.1 transposase [Frankia nepalensis]MBL7630656.1 transposase [Frankia nepalensis]